MDGQPTSIKDIPRNVLLALGMVLIAGVFIATLCTKNERGLYEASVTINGQGKIPYAPDMAVVNLGVQIDKAGTAQQALTSLNTTIEKVIPAIVALGIAREDIETMNYSLYPNYDYVDGITRPSGYNANQQLVVKVRDIAEAEDTVSRVIAEASRMGANQVNGITFEASNLEELKQQGLLAAIEDAKSKAEDTARRAGVELDEIIGWSENPISVPGYPPYYYGEGGMGGGGMPSLPAGTKEIIVQVGLIYSLED